ncbi:MAG TPA: 2-phospho-L-lactate guanylyltransferase [Solirubrobacteraceae bacterium]|nr:2-phospho-L-lactate guanylyltransferase [Solirubrobacteraceae bacterium]
MRTAAVLPVKRFARAKRRLGASVADGLRLELARAMVADVLLALERSRWIERTIVVTRERSVALATRERGAIVVEDDAESGQPAAASLGVRRALAEGFDRVLCVPGDCPALDPAELDALLGPPAGPQPAGACTAEVVIVPDRHGRGTNGLLLCPPDAIPPAFGPDSCERHRALALAAGVACRVERLPSLLLDIDTGADLAALRDRLTGQTAGAAGTRAVLGQPERTEVLSITTPA